jgi:hypothetical protein
MTLRLVESDDCQLLLLTSGQGNEPLCPLQRTMPTVSSGPAATAMITLAKLS